MIDRLLSAKALAALAWLNITAIIWCALFGIISSNLQGAAALVFFMVVALTASGVASKEKEGRK